MPRTITLAFLLARSPSAGRRNVHFDVFPLEGDGFEHLDALFHGEQRIFLEIVRDGDDQLVENIAPRA